MIPEPEENDPELRRTRLYPTRGDEELYGEPHSPEEERRQDLEWSRAESYRRRGDAQGEIGHYMGILAKRPSDLAVIYFLGLTHLESGEFLRVIELIGEAHRRYPGLVDFQELLLEALRAVGKNESGFEWAGEIRIHRLDQATIERCYGYLKRKRRPRHGDHLAEIFSRDGCRLFTGSDLVGALGKDRRFIVEGDHVGARPTRADRLRRWLRQAAEWCLQ